MRARSVAGEVLTLPSFAYASAQDPLDAQTLAAIAVGVTTRKCPRTLEPLRADIPERAVSKSAVSRRFVARTRGRLTTWLATPRDGRMLVRWIAAGPHEAHRGFRRIRGHTDLAALVRILDRRTLDSRKEVA